MSMYNNCNQLHMNALPYNSSSYGIVKRPPFANFLLAIFIINLMMYFGFYTIMKVNYQYY